MIISEYLKIIIDILEAFIYYKMLSSFLDKRVKKRKYQYLGIAIFIITIILCPNYKSLILTSSIIFILYILFAHILFKGKIIIKIGIYISYVGILMLTALIISNLASIFIVEYNMHTAFTIESISIFLVFYIVTIIGRMFANKSIIKNGNWLIFLAIPLIIVIGIVGSVVLNDYVFMPSNIFFPSTILALNIIFYYIISENLELIEENAQKNIRSKFMENKIKFYEEMTKNEMDRRKLFHDYNNTLIILSDLLNRDEVDECKTYLEKISGHNKKIRSIIKTGNNLMDTLINVKYNQALNRDINLILKLCDLKDICISNEDLFAILSNLLDNAIEATEGLIIKDREIYLSISNKEKFIIKIINPIEKNIDISENLIKTTKINKEIHGMGMLIIKETVEQNNGDIIINTDNGKFTYYISIPKK